ncbi:MAG: hypothetical protein IPP40_15410 [bacterium]|nr:hypothetical protein [bacterium]
MWTRILQLYLRAGGTFQIGNWGTEAVESPVVFFVNGEDLTSVEFPEFYFGFQPFPLHLSQSINADSLYIWVNNFGSWNGHSKYLVSSAGEFSPLDTIACCDISVAAFSLGPESFAQLC